jgi:1-aminocyclopropane-1-carboxylate deaminase/D-cysteine desulfhydrase-like pyridoxal-dependent ACC family enzyme
MEASIVDLISFNNSKFYLKRDDLLSREFSGNKARKFYYYLQNDFPNIKKIISHGSSQSNAMYSLSVLTKMRGWEFDYFVDHIPSYLKDNPHGNYFYALKNGMNIICGDLPKEFKSDELFIPEGGRVDKSEFGIKILAEEINSFMQDQIFDIFLPSGTGTTALFLQAHLNVKVYTTPCVGDESYLKKQFLELNSNIKEHPTILNLDKKYHFGKLYREFFEIWIELKKQTNIEFDLLYDPKGWLTMLKHKDKLKNPILYIHQGGLIGNESMLKRYNRKFNENY